MTDEKAKEILYFLARKAGFDRFTTHSWYDIDGNFKCIASVSVFDSKHPSRINHLFVKNPDWICIDMLEQTDYARSLEKMLDWSSIGKNIMTINEVYLPAHASLEQIEVGMDLDCHDRE